MTFFEPQSYITAPLWKMHGAFIGKLLAKLDALITPRPVATANNPPFTVNSYIALMFASGI
jgi:hypothetical protein